MRQRKDFVEGESPDLLRLQYFQFLLRKPVVDLMTGIQILLRHHPEGILLFLCQALTIIEFIDNQVSVCLNVIQGIPVLHGHLLQELLAQYLVLDRTVYPGGPEMLSFSLYAYEGSRLKINFRSVIDDIDISLPGAENRNHIMFRLSQRIQFEGETSVSQSIGLDTCSYAAFVLEQHCSNQVLGIQAGGLSLYQRSVFRHLPGAGSHQQGGAYNNNACSHKELSLSGELFLKCGALQNRSKYYSI